MPAGDIAIAGAPAFMLFVVCFVPPESRQDPDQPSDASEVKPRDSVDGRKLLTPEERAKMLARIHSLVYWVGMMIPEHELLGDSEIDLREVVYNLTTKEDLTPEDVWKVNELIRLLKQKEHSLEDHLEHDSMTVETARELLEEICGLLRAIEELRSVDSKEKAELKKQELVNRVEDARRWQKFLQHIKY